MSEEENTSEIGEISQYPYSVKISQTALGARVSVHSYDADREQAIRNAIYLYISTRSILKANDLRLAPEEPQPKKGAEKKDG